MHDLTTEQLESIRRLLLDPLRETVRTEIQLSHDRLAAAVEKLSDRLAAHGQRTEKRMTILEREMSRLRSFRRRLVAVYGALAMVVSLIWSLVRDKLLSK